MASQLQVSIRFSNKKRVAYGIRPSLVVLSFHCQSRYIDSPYSRKEEQGKDRHECHHSTSLGNVCAFDYDETIVSAKGIKCL